MSTSDDRHGDADGGQLGLLHIDLPVPVADPAFIGQLATAARVPAPHRFARPAARVGVAAGAAALLLSGAAYAATQLTHPTKPHVPVPVATPTATAPSGHHARAVPEALPTRAHRADRRAPRTGHDSPTPANDGQGDQNRSTDPTARAHGGTGGNDQSTGSQETGDQGTGSQENGDQNTDSPSGGTQNSDGGASGSGPDAQGDAG